MFYRACLGLSQGCKGLGGARTFWYHMVPYGTVWYLMVPYGTIWYHMVPYGTLWYLMVPYGTIWSPLPSGWGETLLGREKLFGFLTFEKKTDIFLQGILTFWRLEKNPHGISVILVQKTLKTNYSASSYDTFWFYMVPYSTIWYLMVPYGTSWYLISYGTLWYHKVP